MKKVVPLLLFGLQGLDIRVFLLLGAFPDIPIDGMVIKNLMGMVRLQQRVEEQLYLRAGVCCWPPAEVLLGGCWMLH